METRRITNEYSRSFIGGSIPIPWLLCAKPYLVLAPDPLENRPTTSCCNLFLVSLFFQRTWNACFFLLPHGTRERAFWTPALWRKNNQHSCSDFHCFHQHFYVNIVQICFQALPCFLIRTFNSIFYYECHFIARHCTHSGGLNFTSIMFSHFLTTDSKKPMHPRLIPFTFLYTKSK